MNKFNKTMDGIQIAGANLINKIPLINHPKLHKMADRIEAFLDNKPKSDIMVYKENEYPEVDWNKRNQPLSEIDDSAWFLLLPVVIVFLFVMGGL